MNKNILWSSILLFLLGCSDQQTEQDLACDSEGELFVYCGFQNPEDLALTPDEQYLIVSEYGGMAPLSQMAYGELSLFDINAKKKHSMPMIIGSNDWGEPSCTAPSGAIAPHGIDLVERLDGRWQLAVVNHLPLERVELFELLFDTQWRLHWKGCVDVSGSYYFNDLALSDDGSFYATHMFEPQTSLAEILWNVWSKDDSGLVVRWSAEGGLEELAFTAGAFPNGIALASDANQLIVNYNLGDETRLYDLASRELIASYRHNSPDNVLIREGTVWVTNHDHAALETLTCGGQKNCPLPFSVNKLSLADLTPLQSYKFSGQQMGVGTVALKRGDSLWIGSYHADRLAEMRLVNSQ